MNMSSRKETLRVVAVSSLLLALLLQTPSATAWQRSPWLKRDTLATPRIFSQEDNKNRPSPPLKGAKSSTVSSFDATPSAPTSASPSTATALPLFLTQAFTECDDSNRPPSLNLLLRSIQQLTQQGGSDIRGRFTHHERLGTVASVGHVLAQCDWKEAPPLTPLATYCLGYGLAKLLRERHAATLSLSSSSSSPTQTQAQSEVQPEKENRITIVLGQDPRPHGARLADALARGAESVNDEPTQGSLPPRICVYYTGLATTPACAYFAQAEESVIPADAAVMITASHLPEDRNGLKLFLGRFGQTTAPDTLRQMGAYAMECAMTCYSRGLLPPSSGGDAVHCTAWVDYMPLYQKRLAQAMQRLIHGTRDKVNNSSTNENKVQSSLLKGLTLVLNPGHGSGGFFQKVLEGLGADVSGSIHVQPDGSFPVGVPNPESNLEADTIKACQAVGADLGIMLDTDSDRCGFVVPSKMGNNSYEPLHRNKLIALLGVVFARTNPGCAIVTDSVTSEGLATFLTDRLGLQHVRYLKGYANVIGKARELTESGAIYAPLAIETSGHCAMAENGYLDDGTYTAVKIISLLATERESHTTALHSNSPLLSLIDDLVEVAQIRELRMKTLDSSLETMQHVFDILTLMVTEEADHMDDWSIDRENLEGLRIRTGDSQFFMLRKSLHDPIISLQIESRSLAHAQTRVVEPLLRIIQANEAIGGRLDRSALEKYVRL